MDEMKRFVDLYLQEKTNIQILDIGSFDINGSYRGIFQKESWVYKGLDIAPGQNVDIVEANIYNWNIKDETFDVVISGQTLEHVEYPWVTFKEMVRVLKKKGYVCLMVPSTGKEHRYPVDCWRMFPDGARALAKLENIEVLECHINDKSKFWMDCVLIGRKG